MLDRVSATPAALCVSNPLLKIMGDKGGSLLGRYECIACGFRSEASGLVGVSSKAWDELQAHWDNKPDCPRASQKDTFVLNASRRSDDDKQAQLYADDNEGEDSSGDEGSSPLQFVIDCNPDEEEEVDAAEEKPEKREEDATKKQEDEKGVMDIAD